ncbi:hypothetical protein [Paraburkholderia acidipaludis]|uniref:hypothetical protein n=1 Tax=Paraburkholderia acidipaludis TaxID=660537 RepID=UPI0004861C4C|nr:hypothetical protein [Paraburkholderia acidipaludis]
MPALTNTAILRQILTSDGLLFTTENTEPTNGAPELTSLGFSDSEGVSWSMIVLSYSNAALLRFYSYIGPDILLLPRQRILDLINEINWRLLFESHLDLVPGLPGIRFKAGFRGVGIGLPTYEAREAIQLHVTRSTYLHNLLKVAIRNNEMDPGRAISQSYERALSLSGLTEAPIFL